MKSRISFFNATAFRKDMTRFSPLWGLYALCLMLGLILLAGQGADYNLHSSIGALISFMPVINLGYGFLAAQVLFGDLFNPRMCNALHAMPLRRETWFGTHILSGLLFSLLPTACMALAGLLLAPFSEIRNAWQIPLYWLLGSNLQYLFFFGLGVLSMLCTGNRVAAALVYGIANFGSLLAYTLVNVLYIPLLHGVILQNAPYIRLSPVVQSVQNSYIDCQRISDFLGYDSDGTRLYNRYGVFALDPGWEYLWVIAGVGLAFLALALVMYRRRNLECAGDFMSTKKLEPFFMVLFSLSAAVMFQLSHTIFGYGASILNQVFLYAGLATGWFAGRMLMERQIKVFRRGKNWLGLLALALALAASLGLTKLDLLGIEDWVPDRKDIVAASVSLDHYLFFNSADAADIDDALRIHQLALEDKLTQEEASADRDAAYSEREQAMAMVEKAAGTIEGTSVYVEEYGADSYIPLRPYRDYTHVVISYLLKNDRLVQREYYVMLDTEEGELVRRQFSSPSRVFQEFTSSVSAHHGIPESDLLDPAVMAEYIDTLTLENVGLPEELDNKEGYTGLLQAILADCEAGNMVQHSSEFHEGYVFEEGNIRRRCYRLCFYREEYRIGMYIYADAEHTLAWLEKTGILETIQNDIRANSEYG